MSIKIILADDHKIVRDGLIALLKNEDDIMVVASVKDGREAYNLTKALKPNVVVLDIYMEGLNGILAAKLIKDEMPNTNILMLSMHAEKKYIQEAFQAGALGYLLKDCAFVELADAIRTVSMNKTYLSQKISDVLVSDYTQAKIQNAEVVQKPLSTREKEILQLIAEESSTKEIANTLNVSVKTVETHRKNIMDKLEIRTIAGLTKYAIKEGIVSS
jgi:DNA-binding NarL/FixJ family response regulator